MRGAAPRPLVLFDGDCGFCRRWVARWRLSTRGRVRFEPGRWWHRWLLGLRKADLRRAMQLVEPSGRVSQGAEAVFRMLAWSPRAGTRVVARVGLLPGVLHVARGAYALIARNRRSAARVDAWLFGRAVVPHEYRLVRWAFLRLTGGAFLIAFTSLGRQVLGLYGSRGIRPIRERLAAEKLAEPERERWRLTPTVFWLDASDAALVRGCRAGQLLSLALLFNLAPRLTVSLLWGLYLSYVSVGREFLSFQWDVLLLEMGLLSALTAPGGLRPGLGRDAPSALDVFLFRLLVFRLYFGSGISKLQSGDETWRELTALNHYYETAPLPTRGGWYAHHLPPGFQSASTAATLGLEAGVPFLVLGPRKVRQLAFWAFAGLQGAILTTGNYGFFNYQALALGLWLLDDAALRRVLPLEAEGPARTQPWWRAALSTVVAAPVLVLGVSEVLRRFDSWPLRHERVRGTLRWLEARARPLRSVNSYGLFSVMTVERPEILVEGSEDGEHWKEYSFRYKVGDPERPPRLVAPHQPRLDWQMWFAALGAPTSWFIAFLGRLLEGSPEVLRLLEGNPFPDEPPRMVRAVLYDYKMADLEERRRTGTWWKRERVGLYVPPLALAPGPRPTGHVPRLQWDAQA
ncbi:lipase maturation factor family protein [Pyxidicoccus trucidator]|uniref:lipase maturation factor family protein n=1 Tax=Pyxidicoccus trucidator TaxID=2709662 RepID=UPI001F074F55|nr:lipase maturation factor family protein [Pyxidicoccus trucidator]